MTTGKSRRPAVSIARALSKLGFTSRTLAAQLVREGSVSLNGRTVRDPSRRCDPDTDRITVNGKNIRRRPAVWIVMHKPAGVVTTRSDERGRPTVYDVLGDAGEWLFPVGRLDKETSGLLLMTNDHRFGNRLTSPDSGIPKTYRVAIDRALAPGHSEAMRRGMLLDGLHLKPAVVTLLDGNVLEVTIIEGKNRQIRRMFESFGYSVLSLHRLRIGSFTMEGLGPGEWRYLDRKELPAFLNGESPVPHPGGKSR